MSKNTENVTSKKPLHKKWWFWVIVVVVVIAVVSPNTGNDADTKGKTTQAVEEVANTSEVNKVVVEQTQEDNTDVQDDSTATMGQKNALKKAKTYLDTMAFSYSGLVEQLEYEGYSNEDATYGADNCGADWNDQATKKAESYLDTMAFSRDGLIEQLEYEGFSNEQAVYGAEANGY